MLEEAARQAPHATYVQGDALELPFPDRVFDRVLTGHFYGHLVPLERERFLGEAKRVGRELVVVDASRTHSDVDEEMSQRVLNDGSRWEVFKRYFTGARLAAELGGGGILHEGDWFVVVRSPWPGAGLPTARSARGGATRRSARRASRPASRSSRCPCSRRARTSARTCSVRRLEWSEGRSGGRGEGDPARRCAAGSRWTRTSSTARSTAPRSRGAIPARRRPGAAIAPRRRSSSSCASSGATRSCDCCSRG